MIVLQATIPIAMDHREEMIEAAIKLAEQSRAEAGTIDYRVTTDIEEPSVFRVFEQYEDEAAMEAHLESEHYQRFQEKVGEWIAGEVELIRYDVDSTSEMM
ncbi:putative quinol monooxygenase [Halococcus sp. PRR34]|uniref:putative quinol monooxygenase n=1 Tax=Halococcus sp. PRR34 TaxID=3020830 RepID=UPI0023615E97|nr:putative quinol monooxygenase [Halococcus sp. PRR34]